MFEICALLAPKKSPKVRKASKPAIRIGGFATLTLNGSRVQIIEKDAKYKSAYFVADANGNRLPLSFSRDMLKVEA